MPAKVAYTIVNSGTTTSKGLEGCTTSFPNSNFDLTEHRADDFARTVMWKGSSSKKTAVGRHAKNISSKRRVKSKARQEGSTLGPKILSLVGKHVKELIVPWIRSTAPNNQNYLKG